MDTKKITEQSKAPVWIGAVQVQVANSFFYINLANTAMLAITFWYSAGYLIADRYFHWLSIWTFVIAVVLLLGIVMVLDYKYILPTRQGFMNRQAYKHDNEAMVILLKLQADMAKVKQEMKIVD